MAQNYWRTLTKKAGRERDISILFLRQIKDFCVGLLCAFVRHHWTGCILLYIKLCNWHICFTINRFFFHFARVSGGHRSIPSDDDTKPPKSPNNKLFEPFYCIENRFGFSVSSQFLATMLLRVQLQWGHTKAQSWDFSLILSSSIRFFPLYQFNQDFIRPRICSFFHSFVCWNFWFHSKVIYCSFSRLHFFGMWNRFEIFTISVHPFFYDTQAGKKGSGKANENLNGRNCE